MRPSSDLFRRSLEPNAEIKYYKSNAGEDVSLEVLALVSGTRFRVEEFFEDGKGEPAGGGFAVGQLIGCVVGVGGAGAILVLQRPVAGRVVRERVRVG